MEYLELGPSAQYFVEWVFLMISVSVTLIYWSSRKKFGILFHTILMSIGISIWDIPLEWDCLEYFLTMSYISRWISILTRGRRYCSCFLSPLDLGSSAHWFKWSSRRLCDYILTLISCLWALARFDFIVFLQARSIANNFFQSGHFDILCKIELIFFHLRNAIIIDLSIISIS